MSFIRKNKDWIFAGFFALVNLLYPTIKFVSKTFYFVNNYGSEKKSILFLWPYMLLNNAGGYPYVYQVFYFVLLLPIPIVILASYRFQNEARKRNLIQEGYSEKNNTMILREIINAYKRVIIYVMVVSFSMLLVAIIVPNSGLYEANSNEIMEAIKMNIGFVLFSLIVSNVSIIVVRFAKKYRFTLILGVIGFIAGTLLIALIFEMLGKALGLELLNIDITVYSLIWSRDGLGYLVDLSNGFITFLITCYIIYLLYTGDKSIEE